MLPDRPAHASWLTAEEKGWLEHQLSQDDARAHLGHEAGVLAALRSPKVWSIGLFFFFVGVCGYGFALSAPAILQNATGWSVGAVGWMIALFGLLGAGAMLLNGHHSDQSGDRAMHCIVPCCVMAAGFLVASCTSQPWLVVTSLAASFIATQALWGPALSVPMEFSRRTLRRRRYRGHEYHRHLQRLFRSLLDGTDEGCLGKPTMSDCAA